VMMNKVAFTISVVFHPLLLSTYLVLLLGYLFPPMLMLPKAKLPIFAAVVFSLTFLLPVLNLWIFKQFKIISSLSLSERRERIVPFFFIAIIYVLIAAMFFFRINLSINFSKISIITASLVVATSLLTFIYKVSVHSLSIWGAVGILLPLCKPAGQGLVYATIALIFLSGVIMSSRLQLNEHTPRQVLVGSVLGFTIGFAGMLILF
jgi:membrane-associated phospholipid phosphatase